MIEHFIPYIEAFDLKYLGFNERCIAKFEVFGIKKILILLSREKDYNRLDTFISAPLWQQAFDFFEDKGYFIEIVPTNPQFIKENKEWFYVIKKGTVTMSTKYYKTKEECKLACLKELIIIEKVANNIKIN